MFSDALEQAAADGDHVGQEQGKDGERDDDAEGGGGAKINEVDYAGADKGEIDDVVGDVTLVVHLKPTVNLFFYALANS